MSDRSRLDRRTGRRLVKLGLGALLLALVIWIGSLGLVAWSLQSRAVRLLQMTSEPSRLNITTAAQEVHGARQEVETLRTELAPLLWVGARLGGDLGAAEPLADAGLEALVAADQAAGALAPSLGDLGPGSLNMSAVPRVLDALVAARPTLQKAEAHLVTASAHLDRVRGPLSPRVERWVEQARQYVRMAGQGMGLARIAPELLGRESPRTYLVLVQNVDELRPTGGFNASFGRVVLSHGTIISQTFQDSYAVDDFNKYYPDPPAPLLTYMSSEQWVFRDANWSPDFPTSARDAIKLYQISRPEPIDGVIGINQLAVQQIMTGLEPLRVEGLPEVFTAAKLPDALRSAWDPGEGTWSPEWQATHKNFVGLLVAAMMNKLQSGGVNWMSLAKGSLSALDQRQIMVYSSGPEARGLAELRWDGALDRSRGGDYLMVVDANVGFNKANALVEERIDYAVELRPEGTGRATVTLDYAHHGTQAGVKCIANINYSAISYDTLMNRCYWDYVRVLAPASSRLAGADAHPVPATYLFSQKPADGIAETLPEEGEHAVFGQMLVVEYGQTLQTRLQYDLPAVVRAEGDSRRYVLRVQKQSGTGALPAHILVSLPRGARFISADPAPSAISEQAVEFTLALDTDKQVSVTFQPAP